MHVLTCMQQRYGTSLYCNKYIHHELCMHILEHSIIPLGYYKLKLKLKFVNLVVP